MPCDPAVSFWCPSPNTQVYKRVSWLKSFSVTAEKEVAALKSTVFVALVEKPTMRGASFCSIYMIRRIDSVWKSAKYIASCGPCFMEAGRDPPRVERTPLLSTVVKSSENLTVPIIDLE